MTSIEELEISGIRSFNPNPAFRERIIFFKPLTVILGNNGAGKTTIIECLLNATAGKFPPGCGTERSSFVYDPKVIGDTTVKAQVRLKFTGRDGNLCRVIRSYEVNCNPSRKVDKPKFASLDTVISQRDGGSGLFVHGNFGSSEADGRMRDLLGVSTAVLEHVIFCHQEDCNWPLGSASDVKPIFDAIFAATRYVAALENLKENNKKFSRELKEYERTLVDLRQHKEQAIELRETIKKREEATRIIDMRNKGLDPQIQQLRASIAAIDAIKATGDDLTLQAAQIEGRMHEKSTHIKRMNLPPSKQSMAELVDMRTNFNTHMERLEAEIKQKEGTAAAMEESRRHHATEAMDLRTQVADREREAASHVATCSKILEVAKEFTQEFVIGETQLDDRALQHVQDAAKKNSVQQAEQLQDATREHEEAERAATAKLDEVLRSMDADTKEKEMKERQVAALQTRIKEARQEVSLLGSADGLLDAENLVAALEQRLAAAVQLRQQGDDYQQEVTLNRNMEQINIDVARLRVEISERKRACAQEAQVPFLRDRVAERRQWVQNQMDHELLPGLMAFGRDANGASTSQVCLYVQQLREKKKEALQSAEREFLSLGHELNTATARSNQHKEELASTELLLQRQRAQFVATVGDALGIDQFDAELAEAEAKQLRHCRHVSSIESMAKCYEGFVAAAKGERQCVVCKRGLEDAALADFIRLNEDRQRTTPEQLEKARRDMKASQDRLQKLRDAAPMTKEIRRLQQVAADIHPAIRQAAHDVTTKSALQSDAMNKRKELETQLGAAERLFDIAARVGTAVTEMSNWEKELARITTTTTTTTGSNSTKTLEELEAMYDSLMDQQQSISNQLHELQRRRQGGGDEYAIQLELTTRRGEMLDVRAKAARKKDLETLIWSLLAELEDHRARLSAITARRSELQLKVDKLRGSVAQLQSTWSKRHAELKLAATHADTCAATLASLIPVAATYISQKSADRLSRAKVAHKAAEAAHAQIDKDITALRTDVARIHGIVSDQHRQFANLNNHIQFLELQQSLEADKKRLDEILKDLEDIKKAPLRGVEGLMGNQFAGGESVQRVREMLQQKVSELERVRAQQEGSAEAIRAEMTEMQHKLSSERFHNIDDRYSSVFIKLQTVELTIGDIDKYYKALDKAVQSYHQDKIQQVNAIIAELWRAVYRGSDIDTIELKSEVEGLSATAAGTSKRNYNYRVVMKRGNNEIDMRAKCSAGQKVLASVIIRVALSEAFSCDCGVLALDEPTTNLDEDNARSLAEALRDLIAARRNSHFQLVVITHDEQFVRALGSQSSLERFYFVHKDREGAFSKVEEKSFEQLFA